MAGLFGSENATLVRIVLSNVTSTEGFLILPAWLLSVPCPHHRSTENRSEERGLAMRYDLNAIVVSLLESQLFPTFKRYPGTAKMSC